MLKGFYFLIPLEKKITGVFSYGLLYNGPEILMQINAVTIACIYSFWQQYELMIKLFSFEQESIIFENIFLHSSLTKQIFNFF